MEAAPPAAPGILECRSKLFLLTFAYYIILKHDKIVTVSFLLFSFLSLLLFLFIFQLQQCDDFLNFHCHFSPLIAAFHSSSLSLAFPIRWYFSCSSVFFFIFFFTLFIIFVVSTQTSLFISFSSSSISVSFIVFSFLLSILIHASMCSYLPHSFLLPLHIPVTSMWWFPQFTLSFLGSSAPPAPALHPSLSIF